MTGNVIPIRREVGIESPASRYPLAHAHLVPEESLEAMFGADMSPVTLTRAVTIEASEASKRLEGWRAKQAYLDVVRGAHNAYEPDTEELNPNKLTDIQAVDALMTASEGVREPAEIAQAIIDRAADLEQANRELVIAQAGYRTANKLKVPQSVAAAAAVVVGVTLEAAHAAAQRVRPAKKDTSPPKPPKPDLRLVQNR